MKVKWLILSIAAAFVVLAWGALGVGYLLKPSTTVWVVLVAVAALSLEVLFWVAAGVLGWSIFAKRRAMLEHWRAGLFGRAGDSNQGEAAATKTDAG